MNDAALDAPAHAVSPPDVPVVATLGQRRSQVRVGPTRPDQPRPGPSFVYLQTNWISTADCSLASRLAQLTLLPRSKQAISQTCWCHPFFRPFIGDSLQQPLLLGHILSVAPYHRTFVSLYLLGCSLFLVLPGSTYTSKCMLDKWPVIMPRPLPWHRSGRISDVSHKCTSISIAKWAGKINRKGGRDRWFLGHEANAYWFCFFSIIFWVAITLLHGLNFFLALL